MEYHGNFEWPDAPSIIESNRKLFSHILDSHSHRKSKKGRSSQIYRHPSIGFMRMEAPVEYNSYAPQVIKRTGKGFEDFESTNNILKINDIKDAQDLKEMDELRKKVDKVLLSWDVRPELFWNSEIRTVDDIRSLNLPKEEAAQLENELEKVLLIEKAIDEGTFDDLYDVVQEEERMTYKHQLESQRRRSSKRVLAEKFNLGQEDTMELNEVLADKEKQIISDDVPSTVSWRPEPHDTMIDSYIYKRQQGIISRKSKLIWSKINPYLGVFVSLAYFILVTQERWWYNFLSARKNWAIVAGIFHFSEENFLPYDYQRYIGWVISVLDVSLLATSFLPVLAISYPQQIIHSLCFYAYGIQFVRSFWNVFQWTFPWFTRSGNGDNSPEKISKILFRFLLKYFLLACLIKFHYEIIKPGSRLRERTNRIQWRHNEEIWFKGYSNLRMRMMATRWMHNYSRYHHWNKAKAGEPEATKAIWTDTEEFVRRLEEPGLELADIFKSFRKEHRFQWMKVEGGWEDLEMYQSDPSISTDSDRWVRGPETFRDQRRRNKRRRFRRKYRGYGGDYADKHYTKTRRYRQQEKGLKALLSRHGPQCEFPETEEINKRLYWFRERMLIAFKMAVYQKGGGVYGGEGFSYGCLGPIEDDLEKPKRKVKKENEKYHF